jgi:hypothetical protein
MTSIKIFLYQNDNQNQPVLHKMRTKITDYVSWDIYNYQLPCIFHTNNQGKMKKVVSEKCNTRVVLVINYDVT